MLKNFLWLMLMSISSNISAKLQLHIETFKVTKSIEEVGTNYYKLFSSLGVLFILE